MSSGFETIINAYKGYSSYLWKEITFSNDGGLWHNYFWMLLLVSAFFFGLELLKPWRKNQPKFRKDFWLDFFYMFFNFFLFSLIIYQASSSLVVNFFNSSLLNLTGIDLSTVNPMVHWPTWAILIVGLIVRDFVQWWTHRLLHFSPRLWEFHKVHHSVKEMGFAAHLRYHWMETVVYRSIEYIPLALLGIGLHDFFIIHIFTLAWGHYNHSNFRINREVIGAVVGLFFATIFLQSLESVEITSYISFLLGAAALGAWGLGPIVKYIFNSPEMHIWHHVHDLPEGKPNGINFGITLAIWDYIFGTASIPADGRDIELGFDGDEKFPQSFLGQMGYGLKTLFKF